MKLSVITPSARGVKELSQLLRDFRNQTANSIPGLYEHIVVYDGVPPQDVVDLMKNHANPQTVFTHIKKDMGNILRAPGTRPRNHGINIAKGEFVYFFDDDDRAKDTLVETLAFGSQDDILCVIQMSCQESRMYKNGKPDEIVLIPEVGLPTFPIICHVGTPCFTVPRAWAVANPWQDEPEHDYRFIKRIVERYRPKINFIPGMLVDVDGLVVKGLRDWVSKPPFYRD